MPVKRAAVVAVSAGTDDSMVKPRRDAIRLVAGKGVENDRHFGRNEARAVLLVDVGTYEALRERGLDLPFGSLGENVVIEGVALDELAPGSRVRLGPDATVRLTEPRPRCSKLREVHPDLARLLPRARGVYGEVTAGGTVRPDDAVVVLPGEDMEQGVNGDGGARASARRVGEG